MLEEEMVKQYAIEGPHIYNTASCRHYTLDELNEIRHPSQDPAIAEMQQMVAKMYAHTFSHEQTYKDMLFTTILAFGHKHCKTDSKVFVAVDVKTKDGQSHPFHINTTKMQLKDLDQFCEDFVRPTVAMIISNYQSQFHSSDIVSMSVIVTKKE